MRYDLDLTGKNQGELMALLRQYKRLGNATIQAKQKMYAYAVGRAILAEIELRRGTNLWIS